MRHCEEIERILNQLEPCQYTRCIPRKLRDVTRIVLKRKGGALRIPACFGGCQRNLDISHILLRAKNFISAKRGQQIQYLMAYTTHSRFITI